MPVILVGAEKGGVGKTCLVTNLAALAVQNGHEVAIIDTDENGSARTWAAVRDAEGHKPTITLIPAPDNAPHTVLALAAKFEFIFVDVGANSKKNLHQVAVIADLVLVPCGTDSFEVNAAQGDFLLFRKQDHLHKTGKIPAHVVLTRTPNNIRSSDEPMLRDFLKSQDIPYLEHSAKMRNTWSLIGRTGLALHEMRGAIRNTKAIEEMQAIYDDVMKLLER